MTEKAQIGVTGLAVMGRNLARNFARHGHTVALHNRTYGRTKELVDEFGARGDVHPVGERRGLRGQPGAAAPRGDHGEGRASRPTP